MKGSGSCSSRKSVSLNTPVKLSLQNRREILNQTFTKDGRFILQKNKSVWTISPNKDAKTYKEDCLFGFKAGEGSLGIWGKKFKTLKELQENIENIYENFHMPIPNLKLDIFNVYHIKENTFFWLSKKSDKSWMINCNSEKYMEIYLEELLALNFEKRSEALKYLEKWFAHHNIETD